MGALGVYSRGFYLSNTAIHFSKGVKRKGARLCEVERLSLDSQDVFVLLRVNVCRSQIPCSA